MNRVALMLFMALAATANATPPLVIDEELQDEERHRRATKIITHIYEYDCRHGTDDLTPENG